ncbi:MAG: glycosyltransferase [Nocardioidaceae bacterium]
MTDSLSGSLSGSLTGATVESTETEHEEPGKVRRVLQRVVLPADRDLDVLPLYVDYGAGLREAEPGRQVPAAAPVDLLSATRHPENILSRCRLRVPADQRVSFGTYFNAFAASYWRMYSVIDQVVLRVRVSGSATVIVYRSTPDGRSQRVASESTEVEPGGDFTFHLTLHPFGDGGWYWFDIFAGTRDAVLEEASWSADVPSELASPGTATIGITTFNRTDSCVDLIGQIAADTDVCALLDELIVVDQGTDRVRDEDGFGKVAASLGDRLRVIEQVNLGGSGGFARAQYETVKAGRSRYVLLLDDDIVAEPESILRAVTFGDLASRPTIVGGHMFSLYSRSQLHSYGETINKWRYWWGPAPQVRPEHDFSEHNLRSARWLHRRVDVDFNGWWMCLIPRAVVEEIGLGLPLFIKWDDAEYGVRAAEAGYPTVSMPGVAVWHVPWTDKNDALDWQAYFHQRNRTVTALLHSPYDFGGRVVRESFNHQVKHLLAMQYSTAELRLVALEDVLEGPGHLHPSILTKLTEVRTLRSGHADAQAKPHPDAFPAVKRSRPPKRGHAPGVPQGIAGQLMAAAAGGLRQFRSVGGLAKRHPEDRVAARDAHWWRLAQLDSAVVSTTDGTAAAWYQRDPQRFRELLARSVRVHERFQREWPRLAREYRQDLPRVTSPATWETTFEAARPAADEPAAK